MDRMYSRVIKITAEDSPNVKLALLQRRRGLPVTGESIVPGVLTWDDYRKRRETWDKVRQKIGLDAEFWEGVEILLFPPDWLDIAAGEGRVAKCRAYQTEAVGIDPGEGEANSSWVAVNRFGVKDVFSKTTPNTREIAEITKAFVHGHKVDGMRVCIDRGGGGLQHADYLREGGLRIRTVAFGESLALAPKRGIRKLEEKVENKEDRYVYVNRRAQMYHEASMCLDPCGGVESEERFVAGGAAGFAVPREYANLRAELSPMPKLTDGEGRYWMPPKSKRDPRDTRATLVELIGHSPDEADAMVLAVHGLLHRSRVSVAGVL